MMRTACSLSYGGGVSVQGGLPTETPWTKTPLDRNPPGQRPPDRDHPGQRPPPVNRMTHESKNIALSQFRLRAVKMSKLCGLLASHCTKFENHTCCLLYGLASVPDSEIV